MYEQSELIIEAENIIGTLRCDAMFMAISDRTTALRNKVESMRREEASRKDDSASLHG